MAKLFALLGGTIFLLLVLRWTGVPVFGARQITSMQEFAGFLKWAAPVALGNNGREFGRPQDVNYR